MIQEHLFPVYEKEQQPAAELVEPFESVVNTALSLLACYGAFSLGKVVLKALSTFVLADSPTVPMWSMLTRGISLESVMASYLSSKFAYPPHNTDKSGKQFARLWKLIGGTWEHATQVYADQVDIHDPLRITVAQSPGRVLALLHCVLRERGRDGLVQFLTEKAAMRSKDGPKLLPRHFIFLTRCLFSFHRLTRRWFSVGVRELLSAGQPQHRAHAVPARTVMESATTEMCQLIDFMARVVPDFRGQFTNPPGMAKHWKDRVALFELRSWKHGFISNIMAAFSLCQDVMENYLGSASLQLVQSGDFRHDSSDEDEYGVPKMTRGHTLRPKDAAWLLDLISDHKLSAPRIPRSRGEVEFARSEPFAVMLALRGVGRPDPEERRTNFAMKPLVCFGSRILQHMHRHHGIEMPVDLRTVCNSGPPKPADYTQATDESAVGTNSNEAWHGNLSWIARREVVLHRTMTR